MAPYPTNTEAGRRANEIAGIDTFLERWAREDERIDREFWDRVNGRYQDDPEGFEWGAAIIGAFSVAGTVAVVLLAAFGMAHQSGWLM
jgi:hypothetical protein